MKHILRSLCALVLTAALLCPAAAAADSPVLHIRGGSGSGSAQLTLQNLGNREVNSVQLELTLDGSYPKASFSDGAPPANTATARWTPPAVKPPLRSISTR